MKLSFNVSNKAQADPFIFYDEPFYYLYVTGIEGVEMYRTRDIFAIWEYYGVVCKLDGDFEYWAPSVVKIGDKYYIYFSRGNKTVTQAMHVAVADSPCGPFENAKQLYTEFSIDSHFVQTNSGLFLIYAKNNYEKELKGTRVYIDKFIDPYTPENNPKEIIVPDFPQEKFTPNCTPERDWYTIEGPFWFYENGWHYIMYSGGCYRDDTYHIGYAAAKSDEQNLKNIDFKKVTANGSFSPVIIKNEFEEGTGHNSVIKIGDKYYCVYHGRDYACDGTSDFSKPRTARICELTVKDGVLTAKRSESK